MQYVTLYGHIKKHSNGPLYSTAVIGTLAVDGWAVTFGTARRARVGCGLAQCPLLTNILLYF